MEFKFSCPHCDQHISVNTDMVGVQALCPNCQQQIIVPAPPVQIEHPVNPVPVESVSAATNATPAQTQPPPIPTNIGVRPVVDGLKGHLLRNILASGMVVVFVSIASLYYFHWRHTRASPVKMSSSNMLLFEAVRKDDKDTVELLITRGADVNAKVTDDFDKGTTPLHYAVNYRAKDIAELLINRGADVDAKNNHGNTPLYIAAQQGKLDIAKLLIAAKADINTRGEYGFTPLHLAANHANLDMAQLLLSVGADVNAKADDGERRETPLDLIVVQSGHGDMEEDAKIRSVAQILINYGADVNAKETDGNTPLHLASASLRGFGRVGVSFLLANKALINAKNNDGDTPLHIAALYENKAIPELLLKHGADVNVRNNKGKTPLEIAQDNGNKDVIDLLLAK